MKARKPSPTSQTSAHARAQLDAYFAALAPDARECMLAVREAIRAAAPGAIEAMQDGQPTFRIEGRLLMYYTAWRAHCGMHPISPRIFRAHEEALAPYVNAKGVIQFPYNEPIPAALIGKLVKDRLIEARRGK